MSPDPGPVMSQMVSTAGPIRVLIPPPPRNPGTPPGSAGKLASMVRLTPWPSPSTCTPAVIDPTAAEARICEGASSLTICTWPSDRRSSRGVASTARKDSEPAAGANRSSNRSRYNDPFQGDQVQRQDCPCLSWPLYSREQSGGPRCMFSRGLRLVSIRTGTSLTRLLSRTLPPTRTTAALHRHEMSVSYVLHQFFVTAFASMRVMLRACWRRQLQTSGDGPGKRSSNQRLIRATHTCTR